MILDKGAWKGSKNRKVGGGKETNKDKGGLERKTRLFGWMYNPVMQQIRLGVKVIIAFTFTGTGLESNLSSFGAEHTSSSIQVHVSQSQCSASIVSIFDPQSRKHNGLNYSFMIRTNLNISVITNIQC